MSCTRTFPAISDEEAPAAKISSAAGGLPGVCSDFSSTAIAAAGASSVAMAAFLISAAFERDERDERRVAGVPLTDLFACLTAVCSGEGRVGFFMGRALRLRRPRQVFAHHVNHHNDPAERRKEKQGAFSDGIPPDAPICLRSRGACRGANAGFYIHPLAREKEVTSAIC